MIISLYIHIPFCSAKCDYCDFFSVPVTRRKDNTLQKKILDAVLAEISIRLDEIDSPAINTVFIGGGTPSVIEPDIFSGFLEGLNSITAGMIIDGAEFSTEANTESCSPDFLSAAADGGINRLSLGVQSFNKQILEKIGRAEYPDDIYAAVSNIRSLWKSDFSLDIISGINNDYLSDIKTAVLLKPEHLSVYQLTIEEDTELFNRAAAGSFTPAEAELQSRAIREINKLLESSGYPRYEISNYAKKGKGSLHNSAYWNMQSYIGAGPAAVSSLYENGGGLRTSNIKDVDAYIDCVNRGLKDYQQTETLSYFDFLLEHYIMGCRLCSGVDENIFSSRFGTNPSEFIPETVESWNSRGLLVSESADINAALNEKGLLLLDSFLSDVYSELSGRFKPV